MKETHPKSAHTPASTSEHSMDLPKNKKPIGKVALIIILVLILLAASTYLGYWYQGNKAKTQADQLNQQIRELQTQKQELEDAKAKLQAELDEHNAKHGPVAAVPSAAVVANIEAAMKSGNTAALEGYMAPTVKVTLAASEGIGNRTPAQAVSDLSYFKSATEPWSFAILSTTLLSWRNGPYKQYFPTTAVVGKSANNYVVSFGFDSNGKINSIFMANNTDLLAS